MYTQANLRYCMQKLTSAYTVTLSIKLLTMFMLILSPNKFFTRAILKKKQFVLSIVKQPKSEGHSVYFSSFPLTKSIKMEPR